ncbi:MBOAT family O-acyltransferase [Mucilaginibacter calamicampi]|uniref:MBOAT family O-acyltransferase n=1 Tax=Mucilaginibacter calamicampi TaxID=1302352 RepID=A0ABW2YSZ9_9SPHI
MLFNSLEFAIFFILVTTLYFLLPYKYRWMLLLVSSCYFYMAFVPVYIVILGVTIVIDYYAGILLEKTEGKKRKLYLIISLIANIGVLAIFKYYNFITININEALHSFNSSSSLPLLNILLPIGLSFHTFQAMSYTIEVYRKNQKAERNFGIYALYVMFYPQLVAGPIERPQNILYQFYEKYDFDYQRVTDGLKLMLWGLFKKVVIADRLSVVVDAVYNNPHGSSSFSIIVATIFFAFQIFCDFSGYTDIAIGAAKVMGFKLMTNFNRPYHSKSVSEFWKRWHISLSTWFRDYLYISLGGNRVSVPRWYFNLFFVFLISGLWHGANWTYIIWGALHGIYLVFGLITGEGRNNLMKKLSVPTGVNIFLQVIVTFCLVDFAWIFFRANTLTDAFYIIKTAVGGFPNDVSQLLTHHQLNLNLGVSTGNLLGCVALILLLEVVHIVQKHGTIVEWINAKPLIQRWAIYYAAVLMIIVLGVQTDKQFIYFQF